MCNAFKYVCRFNYFNNDLKKKKTEMIKATEMD